MVMRRDKQADLKLIGGGSNALELSPIPNRQLQNDIEWKALHAHELYMIKICGGKGL